MGNNISGGVPAWIMVILWSTVVSGQTLRERVAVSNGKPVEVVLGVDAHQYPISAMAADSDLVVIGKLVPQRSYLSTTEAYVLTDYVLTIQRVITSRGGASTHPAPTIVAPTVVTLTGGELLLDGVRVTMDDTSRLRSSQHTPLLLFLMRRPDGTYNPYGGASGIFSIGRDERIRSMRQQGSRDPKVENAPLAEIVREIERAGKRQNANRSK